MSNGMANFRSLSNDVSILKPVGQKITLPHVITLPQCINTNKRCEYLLPCADKTLYFAKFPKCVTTNLFYLEVSKDMKIVCKAVIKTLYPIFRVGFDNQNT